jgi:hypothetical protein
MYYFLFISGFGFSAIIFAETTQPDIREGLWELEFKGEISGISEQMPPITTSLKQCMSKDNAYDPQQMLKKENCTLANLNVHNSSASWTMSCDQKGIKMTGSGQFNFQKESMSGVVTMNMSGEAGGMTISTQTTGHYIGVCP